MAFATQNVKRSVFGNLKVTHGDWTGSEGDAAGTVAVSGGRVYLAEFSNQGTTGPTEDAAHSVSTTGEVTTVTVYNHQTVTTGRFIIIHA